MKRLKILLLAIVMTIGTLGMTAGPAEAHAGTCAHWTTHHWVSNSTVHWVYYKGAGWNSSGHWHDYHVYVYIFGNYWTDYWTWKWC